eukprot:scaffold63653_cov25-Tisochrysis_lutea.AAC.2
MEAWSALSCLGKLTLRMRLCWFITLGRQITGVHQIAKEKGPALTLALSTHWKSKGAFCSSF